MLKYPLEGALSASVLQKLTKKWLLVSNQENALNDFMTPGLPKVSIVMSGDN